MWLKVVFLVVWFVLEFLNFDAKLTVIQEHVHAPFAILVGVFNETSLEHEELGIFGVFVVDQSVSECGQTVEVSTLSQVPSFELCEYSVNLGLASNETSFYWLWLLLWCWLFNFITSMCQSKNSPMITFIVITEHISLSITVDVCPLSL